LIKKNRKRRANIWTLLRQETTIGKTFCEKQIIEMTMRNICVWYYFLCDIILCCSGLAFIAISCSANNLPVKRVVSVRIVIAVFKMQRRDW